MNFEGITLTLDSNEIVKTKQIFSDAPINLTTEWYIIVQKQNLSSVYLKEWLTLEADNDRIKLFMQSLPSSTKIMWDLDLKWIHKFKDWHSILGNKWEYKLWAYLNKRIDDESEIYFLDEFLINEYIATLSKMKIFSLTVYEMLDQDFFDFIAKLLSTDTIKVHLTDIHLEVKSDKQCIEVLECLSHWHQIRNVYLNSDIKYCNQEEITLAMHNFTKKIGIISWFNVS